ncbi:glycine--tRNA ligase subunit beta [Campylobacter volucris]|uniref:Glycine--tRNA ligase beta subunit n=1 Tax=Campylobacter volucris TaxID=1031542 RepID=A0AAE5YJ93_9BACT|nr:glycine--tRNA ligase subunit beta [Campylobacter volucris]AJC93864.1 glycyl-tRNA synthetase, beta chain [Campylobacter volucris LMG 24379]KAB0579153.1 glycine--tRNA ligase subunit beta [Campylobacter volucris]QBL13758.1 glycine--tRNA ligase subunit beta [Campylobacter volucris]QEL08077.1 glycyl-tRNA synthetase, beta chain [Campylobacter volucris]TXK68902.1 glycine--tRNA ligase subunit beta [Campylobacter volucris]
MKLLIEIGIEELPAIPLLKELPNITKKWQNILDNYHLNSNFNFFYTPRRLVFIHENFKAKQEDSFVELIGAPKNIAYKDGKLTQAGMSFLEKSGLSESEISFKEIKGKEVLYCQKQVQGLESKEVLPKMIDEFLKSLNFGKTMRWGKGEFEFIRAIRSLSCVLDDKLVEFESYGVKSAMSTFVHRSISYDLVDFESIDEYFKILEKNCVVLDQNLRRKIIIEQLKELENKNDIIISEDDELLAEVVAITEFPKALLGNFEKQYLEIPSEVIITSMRENQRYFAVFKNGALSNHFVVVSNAVCENYSKIIRGNEKVLRARLSDAEFFWKNDLEQGLNNEKISKMIYLEGLGTLKDKVEREKQIAQKLCEVFSNSNKEQILQAIEYSKADLSTQMVYEFTNLQGVMGSYYAKAMGMSDEVALAIKEQYLPNGDDSDLPSNEISSIVALANKFDTLMGLFAMGKIPSGTKDPYALRRAANGVLKIILNLKKEFNIKDFLNHIAQGYKQFDLNILLDFILERLYTFYDVNASFIKAVLNSKNYDIVHIDSSIKALMEIVNDGKFEQNFTTFKRLANIAVKNDVKVDATLFNTQEEQNLYNAFVKCKEYKDDISVYLKNLFALKPQIDLFFDNVMINDQNELIKNNRQALVYEIYKEFLQIADIKEISL